MNITKVVENTYQVTENHRNILFEGLWQIPKGVSINSYVLKGDKTAIIDGFWENEIPGELLDLLEEIEVPYDKVDYLIVNHMEPDHSGWIKAYRSINPNVTILCSAKAKDLLQAFLDIDNNIIVVDEEMEVDLGQGHVLKFVSVPNVHWPDTIATLDTKTKTLFSCDAYGSFGEVPKYNYDDMLTEEELVVFEEEAVRYYSNIVASFSMPTMKAIEKTLAADIEIIAPGHGIVWRKDISRIINDYKRYASYQKGIAKEEITLIWSSMYGMTEKAVDKVIEVLKDEGIKYNVHRVPETNVGQVLASCWNSTGVIVGMPTYEYKMFPPMAAVLDELGRKKVVGRKAFRFGSYGWSGGAQKELDEITERNRMNWDFIDPVEFKGIPRQDDYKALEDQVRQLVKIVRETVNN